MSSNVWELLQRTGVIQDGHFRLTSGRHSERYLQCALALQYPEHAQHLGRLLAQKLARCAGEIELVCAPALGGMIIGYETARALGKRFVFTERDKDGNMTLRRGFSVRSGERVVVVEDVVTTGGSLLEAANVMSGMGGRVVAAGAVVDRSSSPVKFGVPFCSLVEVDVASYDAEQCPLCKAGVPVIKPGSRRDMEKLTK